MLQRPEAHEVFNDVIAANLTALQHQRMRNRIYGIVYCAGLGINRNESALVILGVAPIYTNQPINEVSKHRASNGLEAGHTILAGRVKG